MSKKIKLTAKTQRAYWIYSVMTGRWPHMKKPYYMKPKGSRRP